MHRVKSMCVRFNDIQMKRFTSHLMNINNKLITLNGNFNVMLMQDERIL